MSAMFVTRGLDLWPSDPKINGFPGLIVEHLRVKFGDPSCIGFWDIVRKNRKDTQTNEGKNPTPAAAVGMGNDGNYSEMGYTCTQLDVHQTRERGRIVQDHARGRACSSMFCMLRACERSVRNVCQVSSRGQSTSVDGAGSLRICA